MPPEIHAIPDRAPDAVLYQVAQLFVFDTENSLGKKVLVRIILKSGEEVITATQVFDWEMRSNQEKKTVTDALYNTAVTTLIGLTVVLP